MLTKKERGERGGMGGYKIYINKNDNNFSFKAFETSSKNETPVAAIISLRWPLYLTFFYFLSCETKMQLGPMPPHCWGF